jgi:hypothetical protein
VALVALAVLLAGMLAPTAAALALAESPALVA